MMIRVSLRWTIRVTLLLGLVAGMTASTTWAQQVDYNRAERFLTWHTSRLISGDLVVPEWMEDNTRFWYRNKTGNGYQFVLVDPARNTQGALFDHYRMAASMSLAADTSFNPDKLPFSSFEFLRDETAIEFTAKRKTFDCDLQTYVCSIESSDWRGDEERDQRGVLRSGGTPSNSFVESPDEQWEAFAMDYNLYIRPKGGGDTTQLTTDGEKYWAYGFNEPRPNQRRRGGRALRNRRPNLRWSPDSRRLVVSRRDERDVKHMHYISYTSQRPRHFSQPYALPGDSIIPYPGFHIITIDTDIAADASSDMRGPAADGGVVAGRRPIVRVVSNVAPEVEPRPTQLSFGGSAPDSTWSPDSENLYVTYFTRGSKSVHLAEIDAATGAARVLVSDSSPTFVELSQRGPSSWYVSDDGGDVIWWSERNGWAHLYRFDGNGNLINQITSGPWTVGTVYHVDEARQQIYFTGRGREPGRNIYYAHLYRVNFDGSGLTLLTPEDADHTIRWSPGGQYFVDTYSRIEAAPVTVLRTKPDAGIVRTLEEADISRLGEIGWKPGEVFSVKARDGMTDLYGVIYFPPNIDSTKKYPIISHIYPGPQVGSVGSWRFKGGGEDFALAQLGFVVIQLDHLGTPLRSKALHDNYYGNFGDNGLPDHVAAIKQLAARYPFIDLDRVGIYGHSGGGFASTDAMFRYPDFFKVAVSGAGNHDNRSYNIYWAEKYQGEMESDSLKGTDNFEQSANKTFVENLKGKLLLMHGDMDDNVHPANTIQLINALIDANKDFDFILAPDRAHGLNEPYFVRRRWDYFVRHLLGAEPPANYEIKRPEN